MGKLKKYIKKIFKAIGKYFEFSKLISYITMAVVFYTSHRILDFAELSITNGYTGSLPYLTTMTSVVWAAYGTVLSFIVNKSKAENKLKIEQNYNYGYEQNPYSASQTTPTVQVQNSQQSNMV